ncbi:AvrD family protein [Yaniella flava]|uniref:AvrD family protein n=2 Tax=Yaniella flava TaxID=287930 RepID=A0ABP5FNY8_9MICC
MDDCDQMTDKPLQIKEFLGPAEDRYFAQGYQSVLYSLHSVIKAHSGLAEAVCEVVYPPRWSARHRDEECSVPHLSSVDAVILSLKLLENISSVEELNALSLYRVSCIDLTAGSRPWLRLEAVPIRLSFKYDKGSLVSKAQVGNIRVGITLVKDNSGSRLCSLPRGPETVYSHLFQTTEGNSLVQSLNSEHGILRSEHDLRANNATFSAPGIEALRWPSVTVIDYLVTMGQLTQVLVYSYAGTSRSEAGALWMRTMKIRIDKPSAPLPVNFKAETKILRDQVWKIDGKRIHDVKVESSASSGASAQATLAYEEASTRW